MKRFVFILMTTGFLISPSLYSQPLKDVDGNLYKTVKIGTQTWMAENLKATRLNDGSALPLVEDNSKWADLSSPAYCWFKNDGKTFKNRYGALYNWYAVNTGKLCPSGWHVPSDSDWTALTDYLGGEGIAGGKLKKADTLSWQNPNAGATNSSGFTAISTGFRNHTGSFDLFGSNNIYFRSDGFYWSSTEKYNFNAYYRRLYNSLTSIYRSLSTKESGYSVRCLKNQK